MSLLFFFNPENFLPLSFLLFGIVAVQLLSHVRLFATSQTAACQAPLSFTISQSLLKWIQMPIESVTLSNHLILCCPFLLLPSIFPNVRIFSNESALGSRWPVTGASTSASVLPMNIQGWFPLGLTGLIALQFEGLSKVFPAFESINSVVLGLLYGPILISVHDYLRKHSFDYNGPCLAKWWLCFLTGNTYYSWVRSKGWYSKYLTVGLTANIAQDS